MKEVEKSAEQVAEALEHPGASQSDRSNISTASPSGNDEGRSEDAIARLSVSWVARIWSRMIGIYGRRWASDRGEIPTKSEQDGRLTTVADTWARGLADLGSEVISAGLTACTTGAAGDWPPSAPEFRRIALEAVGDGLPAADAAYKEACQGSYHPSRHAWSHPAVIDAARAVGFRALSHEQPRTTWTAYRRAYEDACRRYRAGEPLADAVPEGLPQSPGAAQPADRDTARRHLDSIRGQLRWRPNNDCAQEGGEARA